MSDPRVFGGVGSNVVYEDDDVRVWQLKLGPGEESPVHRHELDHLLIQVRGDRIAVIPEPDTEGPYTEVLGPTWCPAPLCTSVAAGSSVPATWGCSPTSR